MTTPSSNGAHGPLQLTDSTDPWVDHSAEPEQPALVLAPGTGPDEAGEDRPTDPPVPPGDVAPDVVRRAVAGDDRAFATLVEHYDPMLRELVFHLLGDRDGMDEVLHNAYLKAYRALPRLTAKTEPGPWLYRIAYLATLAELRRRHRRPDRPRAASGPQANGQQPEDPSAPAARPSAFTRELARLPVDHRAAVLLADRAGLPIATVCTVLGLPEAGATKALTRARARLHAALDEDASESELDVQ
jgi:RNA polymerase sigma-70 factor (ECF subfamily)